VEEAETYVCSDELVACTFSAVVDGDEDVESSSEEPWLDGPDRKMSPLREKILVRRLRDHDERAFGEFVAAYQNQVFNLIFRMLGNRQEAEDVAQEVFITIFKNIENFRGDCRLSTWIYRIATNHCRNRIKYLSRRKTHDHREYQDEIAKLQPRDGAAGQPTAGQVARPDQMAEGRQMEKLVQKAIRSLDDDHREVIVLRDIQNLAYQEVCEITGLPQGTVKSRLHRARLALKEKLKDVL
jgi:RNA polymerase sigma-70 factor, ECF subfamily